MKKLFFVAALASMLVSCSYQSKEEPLSENLVKFSAQTENETEVWGVKNQSGTVIVPAEYENVILVEQGHLVATNNIGQIYLYKPDGSQYVNEALSSYEIGDDRISLLAADKKYCFFKGSNRLVGPAQDIQEHAGFFFVQGDSIDVLKLTGEPIISGGKVMLLTTKKDGKHYFVIDNKAYDTEGKVLYTLSAKKLAKLPKPNWNMGENVTAVSTVKALKTLRK